MLSICTNRAFKMKKKKKKTQRKRDRNCMQNACVAVKVLKDKYLHTLDKEQVKLYWTMFSAQAMKVV